MNRRRRQVARRGRNKPKRLKLKYKPRDFKEALLLKRLEEGSLRSGSIGPGNDKMA